MSQGEADDRPVSKLIGELKFSDSHWSVEKETFQHNNPDKTVYVEQRNYVTSK